MASDNEDNRRQRHEDKERERNRQRVKERKRQWEVASDSDDDANNNSRRLSRSRDRSRSTSRDRGSSKKRKYRDKSRKRRRRSRSYSSSRSRSRSDDDSMSSTSSRSRSRSTSRKDNKRKKKHHKRHLKDRHYKDRKKRHHKESKRDRKKDKKRKKSSRKRDEDHSRHGDKHRDDDSAASYSSSSLSDNEREILQQHESKRAGASTGISSTTATFGKYGIIHTSDFNSTKIKSSFERWLAEVKGISSFNGPKHELMEFYKEFMEDYNTATLPHVKYYDFPKWEMEEYARKKKEAHDKAAAAGEDHAALDELRHKEEMAKRAKQKKIDELRQVTAGMTAEKRAEMKHQAQLRHEMAVAYKTGDEEKRKRLQRRLEPEELAKR